MNNGAVRERLGGNYLHFFFRHIEAVTAQAEGVGAFSASCGINYTPRVLIVKVGLKAVFILKLTYRTVKHSGIFMIESRNYEALFGKKPFLLKGEIF